MVDEGRLSRIEEKVDKVLEAQVEMQADLKYHIKRTDLNEVRIEKLEKYVFMGVGIVTVLGILAKIFLKG